MANTPVRQPTGADTAGPLSPSEVPDEGVRAAAPKIDGKRVRAIPYENGSTIEVTKADFANHQINHPKVVWDYRKDNMTVKVGDGISEEAAEFLTKNYPTSFEYMGD